MDSQSDLISPQATKTTFFDNQYFEVIKKYKDFNGRVGRKQYWFFILINTIISVIISFLWWPLAVIFQTLIFMPTLAVSSRRLHDINKDLIYFFIPGYNLILLLQQGTKTEDTNKYGSAIENNKLKINTLYILAFSLLIFSVTRFVYAQQQTNKSSNQENSTGTNIDNKAELDKLNEQSLQEVEQAQTLQEIIQAYQNARKGSEASLKGAMKWISLCQTSQEIKDASDNFPENSDAKTAAFEKWKELSQQELEKANTIEEVKKIYENAPSDDVVKSMIYNKWNELSLEKVEELKTTSEAKEAYNNSPTGSQSRTKILEKWKELVSQELDQVKSFQETKTLYNNAPDDDALKSTIITKWVSFCEVTYETKEVYSYTKVQTDQKLILEKWKELANQEIEQAQDFPDISFLYNNLPSDNKIKSNAIIKWISLCQTYQEAKEVYSNIPSNLSKEMKAATDKWDTLALEAIEQAQTLDAVKEIYNNTPENSTSRSTAAEKIKELN